MTLDGAIEMLRSSDFTVVDWKQGEQIWEAAKRVRQWAQSTFGENVPEPLLNLLAALAEADLA